MKCHELQPLQDAYLDSELDVRTALEVEQHLKSCPECARLFREAERLSDRLRACLNRGERSAEWWRRIEREVVAASSASAILRKSEPRAWRRALEALRARVRSGWEGARWAWTGLAAAWVVVFALHAAAREPQRPVVVRAQMPDAAEMRLALQQKRLLLTDLALAAPPVPAPRSQTDPPAPRSERSNLSRNT